MCSDDYYNKGVYVQLIKSAIRRYFRGWQHGPTWKCLYPKNKPEKKRYNSRIFNEEDIWTTL